MSNKPYNDEVTGSSDRGGAAGLCALRLLSACGERFEPVGFEQLNGIGGTWRYTDHKGTMANGISVHSSMYKNLKTNIPKEVMAFPGFPFPRNLPSFVRHEDVLQYLEDYYQHYGQYKYLKLRTKVDLVEPVTEGAKTQWSVTYSSENHTQTGQFDAVIVCNGHDYRVPDVYKDKVVVCLGAAASGQDVSLDIATSAKKSRNCVTKQRVSADWYCSPHRETAVFTNGKEEPVDVIMLCTGYRYSFPFLSPNCALNIEDERVTPLYKHIIHTRYPTLSFIGICKTICPFPQFQNQLKFVLATLDGSLSLPSEAEMETDTEEDFRARLMEGLPVRHAHLMGPRQWAYNDMLAHMGGFERSRQLYRICMMKFTGVTDLPGYKRKQYRLTGEDSFEEIELTES
ncbi:LOW QUALITY PROTEIN: GSXL4-like protein [Mya arenaria]|uniref:Flavin-containing monooxygenase n=1 Tax=Mya arenaria TaxID=6604 RepID=A0ABY7EXM9_MYAAR|nr:LOW QUALITY PROTEIN: GSXL4-like protein [Mya arenaria]